MAGLGTDSVGLRAAYFFTTRVIICFVSRRLVVAQAGWSDRVNIQHAGRSFEVVLFRTTLGGQTKIQHDAMQNSRTSVPCLFTSVTRRTLCPQCRSGRRTETGSIFLCLNNSPLSPPSLNFRSTDSSEMSVISTLQKWQCQNWEDQKLPYKTWWLVDRAS